MFQRLYQVGDVSRNLRLSVLLYDFDSNFQLKLIYLPDAPHIIPMAYDVMKQTILLAFVLNPGISFHPPKLL